MNIGKQYKRKTISLITLVLTVFVFVLPIAGLLSSKEEVISSENRKIYTFPQFVLKKRHLSKFLDGLSKYLEDRLLFRFSLNAHTEPIYNKHFFKGVDGNKQGIAITGLNNWLYLSWDYYYKQHTEDVPFDLNRQQYVVDRIKYVQQLAGGVPTYVIVGPDKIAVYPEYAVPWIGKPGKYRLADKKIKYMQEQGLTVFDNLALLKQHKKDGILYYLADTHWNRYAAYLAFTDNISSILGNQFVKKPYMFSRTIHPSGDLGIGFAGYKNETVYDGVNVSLHNPNEIIVKAYKNIKSPFIEGTKKELSDILSLNFNFFNEVFETINKNAPIKKTLVVYGDSFYFGAGYRLFCEGTFEHIIFVHHNSLIGKKSISEQLITKFKPDLILYESVERDL